MNKACPLSEEEFCGVLRQALRHPKEYAEVRAILAEGGFTFSEWMGVLCVEVKGRLLSAGEAYAAFSAEPLLQEKVYQASMSVWR
jgi:hypothetical protein